jgi:S1-C subfamily serine protease
LLAVSKRVALSALGCGVLSACASVPVGAPAEIHGMRRFAVGTGFFIGPDTILTNFHVVGGCKALTVGNNWDSTEVIAKFTAGDQAADLAVLAAAAPDVTPARFKTVVDTNPKQTWAIVGYPEERRLPAVEAELDRVWIDPFDFRGDPESFSFNGDVRHGDSGSPVLDDHGSVIGVVSKKLNTDMIYEMTGVLVNDVGIAISNRKVFDFLRANKIAFQPAASAAMRSQKQLLRDAHGFVRQIGCWK